MTTNDLFSGPYKWQEILDVALFFLFLGLFFLSTIQLLKYMLMTRVGPSSPYFMFQRTFYGVCVGVTFGRSLFFVFEPLVISDSISRPWVWHLDDIIYQILSTLPGFMYFSAYILLVFYWAQIFHFTHDGSMPDYRRIYRWINIMVYLVLGTIYALFYWKLLTDGDTKPYMNILFFLDGTINVSVAAAFVLYGGVLYYVLRNTEMAAVPGGRRHRALRKVGAVTIVCTVTFVCRAVFIVMQVFYCADPPYCLMHPSIYALFFICLEFLPTVLMLLLFNNIPKQKEDRLLGSNSPPDDMGGGSIHHIRNISANISRAPSRQDMPTSEHDQP